MKSSLFSLPCLLALFSQVFVVVHHVVVHAEEQQEQQEQQPQQQDLLYSCDDPNDPTNLIPCDSETSLWQLDALNPDASPDDSQVCQELIQILKEAQQQDNDEQEEQEDSGNTSLLDEILSTVVVDGLEPCVLWAMQYGDLQQPLKEDNNDNNDDQEEEEELAGGSPVDGRGEYREQNQFNSIRSMNE
jgi:hypothetical protein